MEIPRYLSKSAVTRDIATFNDWSHGKISTQLAIHEFKKNNNIAPNVKINPFEFEMWLYSLGYGR